MSSYPETIQAITISETGGFEVIQKTTLPFPKVEPHHIVIKIQYLGINFIDTYHRSGVFKLPKLPATLGKEASGVIVGLPSDQATIDDPQYQVRGYKLGATVALDAMGCFATYVSIPFKSVYPVPAGLSPKTAASLLQGLTALSFITEAYAVKKSDTVLVHTIAGGLGLVFAQLIKSKGARVIGTTSTEAKKKIALEAGADEVILYKDEDTVQRVLELTNGVGVNAIYDGVGKDTIDADFKMIKRKGTIVSVGNASGVIPPFPVLKLIEKNVRFLRPTYNNYCYTAEECHYYGSHLWPFIESGQLKIHFHQEYPFTREGLIEAQKDLVGGKTVGKLVVRVSNDGA